MATQNVMKSLIIASPLVVSSIHSKRTFHKNRSLELNDVDEKQVLSLILSNCLRKVKIQRHMPNELIELIYDFFVHEWTIRGLHKDTGTVYDPHGFGIRGIHKKTKNRLTPRGFKQNGFYKKVSSTTGEPTKYDPKGYNIDRWNKDGLYENWRRVDNNGFAQHVGYANVALYKAIKNVDIQAVSLLLKYHANINVNLVDNDGNTLLIACCSTGDQSLAIAKALLEHENINVNLQSKYGNMLLDNLIKKI